MKYQIVEREEYSYIERHNDDGTISGIPIDESNSDYQAYLQWKESANLSE